MPVGPSYVDCSSLSRSSRSSSVAVPLTWIGRVCGVSASSAPRVSTSSTPSVSIAASTSAVNCRQRMLGSMPRSSTTSRCAPGGRATQDLGAGPRDPAHAAGVGADQRPVDLVVVEVLGVDARHHPGVPDVDQVLDQTAGGLGRVVPALERRDQHRADQLRGLLELDHRSSLGRRGPTSPERTRVRRGRATSVPLTHVPTAVPTREEPGDRRVHATSRPDRRAHRHAAGADPGHRRRDGHHDPGAHVRRVRVPR